MASEITARRARAASLGMVLRNYRGILSQVSLAQASGVSKSSISRFESGDTAPEPSVLERLAKVLRVDVHVMIDMADVIWRQAVEALPGPYHDGVEIRKAVSLAYDVYRARQLTRPEES